MVAIREVAISKSKSYQLNMENTKKESTMMHYCVGIEHKDGIYYCAECHVKQCISYFEMFHMQANILEKETLKNNNF